LKGTEIERDAEESSSRIFGESPRKLRKVSDWERGGIEKNSKEVNSFSWIREKKKGKKIGKKGKKETKLKNGDN